HLPSPRQRHGNAAFRRPDPRSLQADAALWSSGSGPPQLGPDQPGLFRWRPAHHAGRRRRADRHGWRRRRNRSPALTAPPGLRLPRQPEHFLSRPVTAMHRKSTGYLFVLPALLVLGLLIAYPIAYTGLLSVTDNQGNLVGLDNFRTILGARATPTAFVNTLWWVAGSIVFQVILGVLAAILLNQNFRGRSIVRSVTLIPWVVPGIVAATTWAWMLHTEFGIINYMLTAPGIVDEPVGWLTNGSTVLPVMIAINVWKMFPF